MTRLASFLLILLFSLDALAFPVDVGQSPDNTLALTVTAIRSAKRELLMNIYQFSSETIAAALAERIDAGVHVEILREGQTVEGLSAEEQSVQARLAAKMSARGDGKIFVMGAQAKKLRRFSFDHAKYVVIDGTSLLIGSENYTDTGAPEARQKPGSANRGWQVWAHDPALASEFTAVFHKDADPAQADVTELKAAPGTATFAAIPSGLDFTGPTLDARSSETVLAPDNSEARTLELIARARQTLDIEHMGFPSRWAKRGSPILDAVIAAARRGVHVRVLINPDDAFGPLAPGARTPEQDTIDRLNSLASDEGLAIEARAARLDRMGVKAIHNKGVLVDGLYTLVASINWTQNSVTLNREAGLVLEGSEINAHYSGVFDQDWVASQADAQGPL